MLPFSFLKTTLVSLNVGKLTDFSMLGIGVETYFAQLVSLGFVFLLMGCASLGNIFTNLNQEPPPGAASSYQFSDFLISTSLGARSTSSNADWVFQSSNAELAGTLIFIVYTPHLPPPPTEILSARVVRRALWTKLVSCTILVLHVFQETL